MSLNIHEPIMNKLHYFHTIHKIPHIIFHGQSGSGKRTIINKFINIIYNSDRERIKSFVMFVNCAHGKGIKFIREELKFFAKTHINANGGDTFKSIILLNADKLTIDAQSALRRCIELFSHTTRFFIIIEDKYKLLKPILSRFCEIYVPEPTHNGAPLNLYKYHLGETFHLKDVKILRAEWLKKELLKMKEKLNPHSTSTSTSTSTSNQDKEKNELNHTLLCSYSTKIYEKGYSGLDIVQLLENQHISIFSDLTDIKRFEMLIAFNKVRKEFRNEQILIMFMLNFIFLSLDCSLENISFM